MESLESYAFIGNEYINLYSDENPIFNIGDTCFCMISNTVDYHRPLIAKGIVVDDHMNDDMSKKYYIQLLEIIENPKTIAEFIYNKNFIAYPYEKYVMRAKKFLRPKEGFDFKPYAFMVDSYFVRPTEEKILDLRKAYINVIRKDLTKMLSEIESL